jgi:NADPH:quinone reductase-like Zn-dependent oxidoreductase
MRAAIIENYGHGPKISDVPEPELRADSVIVEVRAAAINPIDDLIRLGYLQEVLPLELPWTMGFDVSGVVVACGADVTRFSVSDEVFGRADTMQAGTIAELVVVKETALAAKPDNISHIEAASIPLAGLTAWQALVPITNVQKGERVLIHAGSGGVGSIAIQIAKQLGAFVATTTSAANAEMVANLGADLVIDYHTHAFEKELSDFDVVFDMLGGETLEKSFSVLKPGGRLVSIKGEAPDGLAAEHGVEFTAFMMSPDGAMLSEIGALLADGRLHPVVDRTYPLDETADAYSYIQSGRAKGKIVIEISND